ncbi:hypothetical protein EEL32_02060 [Brevibacillus laterosporus]|uniref:Uncharacterized protein n=1 Tax=Brevibacillus laterosporus TaxID=1465 RepID=A0A502J260_BRELA|nr:hypothetical protein [Brevibacillus laterosporus]QDX95082.1 hypothetical protein EEL30_23995 [Brevibacillus laterosporus]TPG68993.1 hypothetical protein EEL31_10960 [Brevibacillus laterosporus]TPG92102.1 hypothetical protein EEL32_02060 [Brevibacillus laterosporus]
MQFHTEFQDKLQKANEEYTAKIQSLYERIEQLREDHEQELKLQSESYNKQITELKKQGKC